MLSVIIPTLNEEKNIKKCIECVKEQKVPEIEIIVVDVNSKDNTVSLAKALGAKVIRFKPIHTSKNYIWAQKNYAIKRAEYGIVLFLDADTFLYDEGLLSLVKRFEASRCGLGIARIKHDSPKLRYKFLDFVYYLMMKNNIGQSATPGAFMLVKRSVHDKVGGCDEKVLVGEDHEYGNRLREATGICKYFGYSYYTSVRRFEKDGYMRTLISWLLYVITYIVRGPVRNWIIPYKFGDY